MRAENHLGGLTNTARAMLLRDPSMVPEVPMILRGPRPSFIFVGLIISVFLAVSAFEIFGPRRNALGFVWVCFLLYGLITAAIALLPHNASLVLTEDGFTFTRNFSRRFVSWQSVLSFRAASGSRLATANLVGWNYVAAVFEPKPTPRFFASRLGFDDTLPSTYGIGAGELCEILNRLRNRFGAPTADLWRGVAETR